MTGIDKGVAFRLRKMHRHSLLHFHQIMVSAFDLVDGDSSLFRNNAVGSSLHHNLVGIRVINPAQGHLRPIGRAHPPLNHTMDPTALLHGVLRRHRLSIVNIAGAQNKLHQTPHRNTHFHVTTSYFPTLLIRKDSPYKIILRYLTQGVNVACLTGIYTATAHFLRCLSKSAS